MTPPPASPPPGAANPRATYYAEARSWAADRQAGLRRALRTAWIVASVAATVAALEALALAGLAPLKTVVPYTLLVDRNTGFAEALTGSQPPQVDAQSALAQSLLAQYVIAREGFDITTLRDSYHRVALWSADGARRSYLAQMPASQPDSPLARLPRAAIVDVTVESVSWLAPGTALVRFTTWRRDAAGAQTPRRFWIATLGYRFSGEPMTLADRLVNPLGFQVTRYRRDEEAPPQAPGAAADAAPAAAGVQPSPAPIPMARAPR